jgi:hypothetical protein
MSELSEFLGEIPREIPLGVIRPVVRALRGAPGDGAKTPGAQEEGEEGGEFERDFETALRIVVAYATHQRPETTPAKILSLKSTWRELSTTSVAILRACGLQQGEAEPVAEISSASSTTSTPSSPPAADILSM